MKKIICLSVLFLIVATTVFAQTNEQIVIKKKRYYLEDKKLNNKELKSILKSEPESAAAYKKARTNNAIGSVFAGISTVSLIYAIANPPEEKEGPLPGLVSEEEMDKAMIPLYIAGGCILASLPFFISGNKQLKKSVTIYNSKKTSTGYRDEMKLDFGLTQNGVGAVIRF